MGAPNFSLVRFSVLALAVAHTVFLEAESRTEWGDIQALKEVKERVEPSSMTPGSCLSSWDFAIDPCDNLFGDRFTCGFRCDAVVGGASRVTELSLDRAGYAGELASSSWNLPYLDTLDLTGNSFSGPIPESLANLTRLRRLSLSANSFSGEIPASIGWLSGLEELSLDNNELQGPFPASLNGLVSLKRLELQSNRLSGAFPDLVSLGNLTFLDASDNAISGQVPAALPPSLVTLAMRNNSLRGTIPDSLRNMAYLQVLDLSHNGLDGSVPSFLFTHPSLEQLTLSFNHLATVEVPDAAAVAGSQLVAVDLSNNALGGTLPASLTAMPRLAALSVENNELTGMIPTQYALKAVLPAPGAAPLARLLLGGNYLFGAIPAPFLQLKPDGAVNVSLAGNCLYRCPARFFFCQGRDQKSVTECNKILGPGLP